MQPLWLDTTFTRSFRALRGRTRRCHISSAFVHGPPRPIPSIVHPPPPPIPFPPKAACCLFHYTVVRPIPGQPASRGSGTVVAVGRGRSRSVGRSTLVGLIYEGEWLRFPPKLNSGAARPLPPSLFMDAFYLHRFPTIPTSFLPCPALPPAAIFQNRSHGRPNTDTQMELLVFLPTATALHCGMSCPRNRVKHFVCLTAMGSFIFTQPPAICQICIAIYRDRLKSMLQVA